MVAARNLRLEWSHLSAYSGCFDWCSGPLGDRVTYRAVPVRELLDARPIPAATPLTRRAARAMLALWDAYVDAKTKVVA